jgi:hypothetical protein
VKSLSILPHADESTTSMRGEDGGTGWEYAYHHDLV